MRHFAPLSDNGFLANWLSRIVNIDRPSVEERPEQHNQLNLSLGCLRATCQARSTLMITQPVSGVAGLSASSDISRGSVATHLRCGGICSNIFITNCLLILTVKEFWKSVNIWWNYEVYINLCHFLAHPVYIDWETNGTDTMMRNARCSMNDRGWPIVMIGLCHGVADTL